MPLPIFVINLDSSVDRWTTLSARAEQLGLAITRVPAIDGRLLDRSALEGFSETRFRLCHGRTALAAEYGCYMSHLRAMDMIVAGGHPYAIILEDDALLADDFVARTDSIAKLDRQTGGNRLGVVKLYNHRLKGFRRKATTAAGDEIGSCLHGPLGSSMAYVVSRQAAQRLRQRLLPMFLPYDVALERDWSHGVPVFETRRFLVSEADQRTTTIGGRSVYKATKLALPMRIPAAFFRAADYAKRFVGALVRPAIS
ncbi:glycosyltransferase family 25 protein [Mesorhizobium sp. A623]